MAYRILIQGRPSVINVVQGNISDPFENDSPDYAFSNGRFCQKTLNEHKRDCLKAGLSLEYLTFTIEKGEFVPYEKGESDENAISNFS